MILSVKGKAPLFPKLEPIGTRVMLSTPPAMTMSA